MLRLHFVWLLLGALGCGSSGGGDASGAPDGGTGGSDGTGSAEAGELDPSFGDAGVVGSPTALRAGDVATIGDLAVGPDDSIVIAGALGREMMLARVDAEGMLDASFGMDSFADLGSPSVFSAVDVAADGSIVALGSAMPDGSVRFVVRLDGNGERMTEFGQGGRVVFESSETVFIHSVAFLSDGSGIVLTESTAEGELCTVLEQDGTVRTDWGDSGAVSLEFVPELQTGDAGTVFVFGTPDGGRTIVARRLDAEGAFDPSFGDSGTAVILTADPVMEVVDPDTGELVGFVGTQINLEAAALSGSEAYIAMRRYNLEDGSSDRLVARLTSTGELDGDFGVEGIAEVDVGMDIVADRDGRPVLAGGSDGAALVRLTRDGSLDPTFGVDGSAQPLGRSVSAFSHVGIQSGGGIVATSNGWGFFVARILP